jgi:hypothetical protein
MRLPIATPGTASCSPRSADKTFAALASKIPAAAKCSKLDMMRLLFIQIRNMNSLRT